MKNIAKHWPTIRQVTYSLLAAAGALGVGAGLLTDSELAQYLGIATLVLTTLGNVLAGLFVDRASPEQVRQIEIAAQHGAERVLSQVQQGAATHIDTARRHAEQVVDQFVIRPRR